MFCKNCGNPIDDNTAVCMSCGTPKGLGNSFCANCGTQVDPSAAVCINCGATLNNNMNYNQQPQMNQRPSSINIVMDGFNGTTKSKTTACALAWIFGAFGAHDFYLGDNTIGLIKLLVSVLSCGTLSVFMAFWSVLDLIAMLTGKINTDANGNPLV